jgi:ABC-2 type transport system ATP-binding protein
VKRFGVREVLAGVNLSVPRGSVLGLLGKNGAGKTTMIKCALGLLRPNQGEISLLGEPSATLSPEAKARIGYVPQEIPLYPWMRVGHLLNYTSAFYPKWNEALVRQLIGDWEVDESQRVGKLSVGTRQKLAIILALAHEPDLLVLDEPAASLDPAGRRDFLKAVLEVSAEGNRTVIFSTHLTFDLERVADRVAILRGGRIAYDGELDALKESVKRLHLSASSPLPAALDVPGAVRSVVEGKEALLSVRDVSPQLLEEIGRRYGATIRVEDLNLEDIFLEVSHAAAR